MAVAQPLGSKAVEVLAFHDSSAGKAGPIALQMHNAGLFDEQRLGPASETVAAWVEELVGGSAE